MADGPDGRGAAELAANWAADWAAIWQSELSASATDRERAETWSSMLNAWSDAGAAWLAALPVRPDASAGPAARPPPAGPAPADAASAASGHVVGQLLRRVEELERRLAERDAAPG